MIRKEYEEMCIREAMKCGHIDYHAGKSLSNNPFYYQGIDRRLAWEKGWLTGYNNEKKINS